MKRQFALLFALTFLVSGMATMAEEASTDVETTATVEAEIVENAEAPERTVPFEDGDWMSIPEWNAEVYLPTGWLLSEVTETGFIATDAEETSTLTVTLEDFLMEKPAGAAPETEEAAEETAETEDAAVEPDAVEPSAFEEYLTELGLEYELAQMGDRQAAVLTGEDSVAIKFLLHDQLVTMDFAPAAEGGIADSALSIAETFYVYDEVRPVEGEIPAEAAEETVEETAEEAETAAE